MVPLVPGRFSARTPPSGNTTRPRSDGPPKGIIVVEHVAGTQLQPYLSGGVVEAPLRIQRPVGRHGARNQEGLGKVAGPMAVVEAKANILRHVAVAHDQLNGPTRRVEAAQ